MGFRCKSERKQISEMSPLPSKPSLAGHTGLPRLGFTAPTSAIGGVPVALLSASIYPGEGEGPDPHPSTVFWGDSVFLGLPHPGCMQTLLSGQGETCLGRRLSSAKNTFCVYFGTKFSPNSNICGPEAAF